MREGLYYRLDCMNALASGLYKASDFTGDEEAIETASNYEATLTKEEYKRLYEERLKDGGQMPATPEEYKEAFTAGKESRLFSISWLSGSIDPRPQEAETEPVKIIEERPAATLELDPEEYRRIKEELEKERESTSGYYHEPEHFYSMGKD